jgi:tetratricopeptide (TPR) repeat protein
MGTKEKVDQLLQSKQYPMYYAYGPTPDERWSVTSVPRAYIVDTNFVVTWIGNPKDNFEERVRHQMTKTPPTGSNPAAVQRKSEQLSKLVADKRFGKAYTIARSLREIVGEEPNARTALETAMKQIEEGARQQIDEIRRGIEAKSWRDAAKAAAELFIRFEGNQVSKDADTEIQKILADRDGKAIMRKALDNARGEMKMEQAVELQEAKQFLEATKVYEQIVEKYPETDVANEARSAIDRLKNDAAIQRATREARIVSEADRLLEIGERYAKVSMVAEARQTYEKIVADYPNSRAAMRAKELMNALPKADGAAKAP